MKLKTFEYIHVTLKWKKKNIHKPEIHLQKCLTLTEDCYKTMLYVLIYDSSKPY